MFRAQMSQNEKGLYYLFPGQKVDKHKKAYHLAVAVVVGLVTAGLMATVVYLMET